MAFEHVSAEGGADASVREAPDMAASLSEEAMPLNTSPKLTGKKRLVEGLKRMGSSQSIFRMGRSQASTYRGVGKGSVSCISLSSSTSAYNNVLGSSYGSNFSNGYSTAPTSVPGTPSADTPFIEGAARVRFIGSNGLLQRGASSVGIPSDLKCATRPTTSAGIVEVNEDYFCIPVTQPKHKKSRPNLDFWGDMPAELRLQILRLLKPKEIVRCSTVSKSWHHMCFDGQIWASLDTSEYYRDIPGDSLVKIIARAGPFVKDLNLRGCVQLWDRWRPDGLSDACRNLQNISLEGCRIDRASIHGLLYQNPHLVHVNLSGLAGVTNSTLKIIAQQCKRLELLNVSWCNNVDSRGLRRIVQNCHMLVDLRAGEIRDMGDTELMLELFNRNTLERLLLTNCESLTDEALAVLFEGKNTEVDFLTGRHIVPGRRLKHLDLSRCRNITDNGLCTLAHNAPELEGLRLSKCKSLTDYSLTTVLPTLPRLTHLDLEELDTLSNIVLQELAKSPCAATLKHLSISYCEALGDTGMLPIIKSCPNLRNLELDNTRVSNLVLAEAAAAVRARPSTSARSASIDAATTSFGQTSGPARPRVGLRIAAYDCQNVTWTGIREVLSRNAEIRRPNPPFALASAPSIMQPMQTSVSCSFSTSDYSPVHNHQTRTETQLPPHPMQPHHPFPIAPSMPSHPRQVIALKVFYGYQPTVLEHTRRVLRGDLAAASRLERKWAEYMMASEEAGAPGGFGIGGFGPTGLANRRRRRRARDAMMLHADEEEGVGGTGGGIGRRRRARSGGCTVM